MLKRSIRWIVPLLVVALIAVYFVASPLLNSHAASITRPVASPSATPGATPSILWNPQ
jgi:hypothetical protein